MWRKLLLIAGVIILLGATGHAFLMLMARSDRALTPQPDQALIVFMRPKPSFGRALWSDDSGQLISIHDVTTSETKFIGILERSTKIGYDVAPGEYTFMVASEAADFMKATVSAGKTYYAILLPRTGFMKARFSFQPLRRSDLAGEEFSQWNSGTFLVKNTPKSEDWAKKEAEKIEEKQMKYWPDWVALPLETRNTMTLNSEDGI